MTSKIEVTYGKQDTNMSTALPNYTPATTYQSEPQGPPQQVVIMQSGPQMPPLGPQPVLVQCPHCHGQHMSIIKYENSGKTHLMAIIMGVTCLCCCIPYCCNSCKKTNHYCSNCNAFLGTYSN